MPSIGRGLAYFTGWAPTERIEETAERGSDDLEHTRKIRELRERLERTSSQYRELQGRYQKLSDGNTQLSHENSHLYDYIEEIARKEQRAQNSRASIKYERDTLARDHHHVHKALEAEKFEAGKLRQQLTTLKAGISSSSRVDNQVTDEEIALKMDRIFYSVQDFSVRVSRGVKLDFEKLSDDAWAWISQNVHDADKMPKSRWPHILNCLVSKTLIDQCSPQYYCGMSRTESVRAAMSLTIQFMECDVTTTKSWMQLTRRLLSGLNDAALRQDDQFLIDSTVDEIYQSIASALSLEWSAKIDADLRKISNAAFELFSVLHNSKATFRVQMSPEAGYVYRKDLMQVVDSAEEEDEPEGKLVEAFIFPGIYKFGDELGENVSADRPLGTYMQPANLETLQQHQMTVVSKARVML